MLATPAILGKMCLWERLGPQAVNIKVNKARVELGQGVCRKQRSGLFCFFSFFSMLGMEPGAPKGRVYQGVCGNPQQRKRKSKHKPRSPSHSALVCAVQSQLPAP